MVGTEMVFKRRVCKLKDVDGLGGRQNYRISSFNRWAQMKL